MKKLLLLLSILIVGLASNGQLLFKSDWETGDILQKRYYRWSLAYTDYSKYPNGYSARLDSSIFKTGKKSIRLELRSTDSMVGLGKRAELYINQTDSIMRKVFWYAWSEYLPSNYAIDSRAELHMQISVAKSTTNPNVALWLVNDKWYMNIKFDSAGTGAKVERNVYVSSATTDKGKWTSWILYYAPSIDYKGRVTLWKNGVKVFDRVGANANKLNGGLDSSKYFKFGIYKWTWNVVRTYSPSVRILYFDDVAFYGASTTINGILNAGKTFVAKPISNLFDFKTIISRGSKEIKILFGKKLQGTHYIRVVTPEGKILYSSRLIDLESKTIYLLEMPVGVYYVQVMTPTRETVTKLIMNL